MTPDQRDVDFRIVRGDEEETGFEIVDRPPEADIVPVDERWALVPAE